MKNYIKPEVKVYEVRIESLLSGSGPEGRLPLALPGGQ